MKMANMDDYFDVVIVGTGAAGLYCALNLPARYRILLLTKQKADESDSFLAQGGICMQHGEADYRPFFDDKPDLAPYREQEPLFAAYRQEVLTAIERSKNHE